MCALGCGHDPVEVIDKNKDEPLDYGHTALVEAANALSADPNSPQAYRTFREKVDSLRNKFSEAVSEEAERYLVFLALGPLDAVSGMPREEQLDALAVTVWPTAFEVAPRADESPRDYLLRVCGTDLALSCKHIVPDYWPVMLGAMVWTRLKERAHVSYRICGACQGDNGYLAALAKYDARQTEWSKLSGDSEEEARPKSWPVAGKHAAPWSGAPLYSRDLDGNYSLNGVALAAGKVREALANARGERDVMGIYVHPREEVRALRAMLDDVARAGYAEAALLALEPRYPYGKREYRLAVGRRARGKAVHVRGSDTVQVLVQGLDIAAAGAEAPLRLK